MAIFSHLLERALTGTDGRPDVFDGQSLVIVADWALSAADVRGLMPDTKRAAVVVEAVPDSHTNDDSPPLVEYVHWSSLSRPGFAQPARRVLRNGFETAWFHRTLRGASGRMLREMQICGIKRVVFDSDDGSVVLPIGRAIWRKFRQRVGAGWLHAADRSKNDQIGIDREIEAFAHALSGVDRSRSNVGDGIDVLHYISSLESGGAERQAALLCREQLRAGMNVQLRTMMPLHGALAHHRSMLDATPGVIAQSGQADDPALVHHTLDQLLTDAPQRALLERVPVAIRRHVTDILFDMLTCRPRTVHCWLDEPNVYGGIAALIAGVPRVVLSTRNVNPTNFASIHQPWMRGWYQLFVEQESVQLVANSRSGAADYARWIGVEPESIAIVPNAIDPRDWPHPTEDSIAEVRRTLGASADETLVIGMFRLAPEKDPQTFLEVMARLVRQESRPVRGVIVGTGPMLRDVERARARLGLTDRVMLAGRREDVAEVLAAADVVLLTSRHEGTPNCLLEALVMARPVVATDAGSSGDVVHHGRTGLLAPVGDVVALRRCVAQLLADRPLGAKLGAAGRSHVLSAFSPAAAMDRMTAVYGDRGGTEVLARLRTTQSTPLSVQRS